MPDGRQIDSRKLSAKTLHGGDLAMQVDAASGTISALHVRGHPLHVGRHGYVAVEDRTTRRFHFKPEQAIATEPSAGDGFAFRQTDESGDMTMAQRFLPGDKHIEWSVEVSTSRQGIREIHLHFVVPIFGPGSHGFTAHARCPMVPGTGNDHMMVVYSPDMWNEELFHCSVLPMVSSYDPHADAGVAIVQPVDIAKPRMEYFFVREQPDVSLVIRWTHLRLCQSSSAQARMLLVPIRGCWRDAVRVVRDLYPDHFRVPEPAVYAHEGPTVSGPIIRAESLDRLVSEQHLSWASIHARVFSRFGEYAPQEESWPSWVRHWRLEHFDLERLSRTEFRWLRSRVPDKQLWKEETIGRRMLNDYIAKLHERGVAAFLYINPVIASIDRIDAYPGSLATSADGTPLFRDYHRTAPFNPAADTTWAKHLDAMTQRMLDIFPQIDGLFLDELHYNQFDFAHDDGVSARGGSPVAMLGFAVQDAARRICDAVHQRGKAVWSNGSNTLEVARHVDGLMAEVSSEWLGTILYLALEKPMVLLFGKGPWTAAQLERDLNTALFAGAQPSVMHDSTSTAPEIAPELLAVVERYRPLFRMLRGRRWILHPHAIEGGRRDIRMNCFALPDGDFALTFSPSTPGGASAASSGSSTSIRLRWPGVENVTTVELFNADEPGGRRSLGFRNHEGGLAVEAPTANAGILRLNIRR